MACAPKRGLNVPSRERALASYIAFSTIVRRESVRMLQIWPRSLASTAIMTVLYLTVFGEAIGARIGPIQSVAYIDFIVPGLTMMSAIQNSYNHLAWSVFGAKFGRHVEELLISPMPAWLILAGYLMGGAIRGLIACAIVLCVAAMFTDLDFAHPAFGLATALLAAICFSLVGFLSALHARSFEDIAAVPSFVLTPLLYLGGVFHPQTLLPGWANTASLLNPMLYVVDAFRYSMLGVSQIEPSLALTLLSAWVVALGTAAIVSLSRAKGLRH